MDKNRDGFNVGGFTAFVFSVVFCLVFFFYISFMHPQIDLKEVTEQVPEAGAAVKIDLAKVEKLWAEMPELLEHGKKVYANNCAVCHGGTGMGDGAAGATLKPPPRNFVEGKWTVGGKSKDLYLTIANGISGTSMAGFKHLSKVDRWGLVQYIRAITKNKVADDSAELDAFGKTAE